MKKTKWSLAGISLNYEYIYGNIGEKTNMLYRIKLNGVQDLKYTYDELCRLETRTLATQTPYVTNYGYHNGTGIGSTTNLIAYVNNGGNSVLEYYYDANGNITAVTVNGVLLGYYTYDSKNQLISAQDYSNTYNYTYDDNGNILSVTKNGETVKTYIYGDTNWKDLLTGYNGQTITYDTIGNPIQYRDGFNFTWANGRQLTTVTKGENSYSYTYNADSLRTSKTVNGVTTNYYWSNGILQAQKTGDEYLIFLYDENGGAYGFLLKNGTTEEKYYYIFNAQGDVIGIIDSNGSRVVEYYYDTWGNLSHTYGPEASTIGQLNPIRYRGYYYDAETGFYYLQTRYYDPETGRFINADGAYDTNQGVLGYNMYIYCLNNPTNMYDPDGNCSRFLGFLWKIDCKQASCSTSKNYIKPKAIDPIGTYNNGQGYVYLLKESQLDIMKNKEKNAVVIIDNRTNANPSMRIQDSYKISNKNQQKQICEIMVTYNTTNPVEPAWNRTVSSMLIEWKAHNDGYRGRWIVGLFKENAKERLAHVDLDNAAEGLKYWDYLGK